jgi:hypothetical protein
MTKKQHIDQIEELLGEAYYDKISKPVIEVTLNTAYNQICSTMNKFDLCRKRFTGIPVVWDSSAEVYYSDYPAAIVPTINSEMIVSTIKGSGALFSPTTEQESRLVYTLSSNDIDNRIYTILKRERIEYENMESLTDEEIEDGATHTPKVPTVRMDLAIEFKEFEDTDEVYMPAGKDYEVKQIALDMLRNEPIIDVRND